MKMPQAAMSVEILLIQDHGPVFREVIAITGDAQEIFANAVREQHSGQLSPTTELIQHSTKSSEPDGGCLIDLARALLNSPDDVPGKENIQ
jgi:hypothetical protein